MAANHLHRFDLAMTISFWVSAIYQKSQDKFIDPLFKREKSSRVQLSVAVHVEEYWLLILSVMTHASELREASLKRLSQWTSANPPAPGGRTFSQRNPKRPLKSWGELQNHVQSAASLRKDEQTHKCTLKNKKKQWNKKTIWRNNKC